MTVAPILLSLALPPALILAPWAPTAMRARAAAGALAAELAFAVPGWS